MVIKVPIIVSYNNKGTKQATKGIGGLEKSFKSMGLASKLSYAAAGTAALAFAKKSIAAALADQKQQVVLAKTLANVGESFATASVTKYIDSLQRATGVSEDQLRPAFNKLVTATLSASKAQDLLALSLDISAATGKSSESVAAALSKAYLGNNTALGKLGVGLTKTELKSMTFEETTQKLSTLFAGQASATANTYAGQLAVLGVAANEASETIGTALIESIAKLGGQNGAKDLATQMQGLADSTANVITGITVVIDYFKKLDAALPSWLKTTLQLLERFTPLGQAKEALKVLEELGVKEKELQKQRTNNASDRGTLARAADIADKAAKAALKSNAKIIEGKSKIVAITKAQAANEKLARMFDMDAIQLAAALQGKLSKEDEARVKALQALKTTDKNDDITALNDLENAKRAATFAEIARLKSVVEESKKANEEILADARARISALSKSSVPTAAAMSVGAAGGTFAPGLAAAQSSLAAGGFDGSSFSNLGGLTGMTPEQFDAFNFGMGPGNTPAASQSGATNLTVNLQGGINVGSTYEFYQTVQTALQELNRAGNSLTPAGN